MDCFYVHHLMDKDVHSFHANEMALMATSPFVETIFNLSSEMTLL
jgi:hypothetical protein